MTKPSEYALGYSEHEHRRLERQAERWHTSTEQLFREAGLVDGSRVLELGSGVGDVAMLVAHIVGPTGEVVGVERDAKSVEQARIRAAGAGFANLTFVEADLMALPEMAPFDAVVGRFILQFLPDAAGALRHVSRLLKPLGIVAFQEVSWAPALAANAHLALWSTCASVTRELIDRTGANTDVGLSLRRLFLEAGIPEPDMRLEMKMGVSRNHILWTYDLLISIRERSGDTESLPTLGDLSTLPGRLQAEVDRARSAVTSIAAVSARSRFTRRVLNDC